MRSWPAPFSLTARVRRAGLPLVAALALGGLAPAAIAAGPPTRAEANRFLAQATFGPVETEAELVQKIGYGRWIDQQFALPATSHRAWWEARDAQIKALDATASANQDQVWESFWRQAVEGPDQLRQRVAYALSQIFVISAVDGQIGQQPRAMAAWLDMLGQNAFGNYRTLLESVSLHPLMGLYLTHLRNQKPNLTTGRIPDQNYARESMQLFSIGLIKLRIDGTPDTAGGAVQETYGPADVAGLSNVFTGFSWACPAAPAASCFNNGVNNGVSDPDRHFKPMIAYPQYHSTDPKTFLGVTIPAQSTPDPALSLRMALDTLANHPNVGPFIGKQLIQRLVSSNPSPAYVQAVAEAFNNNGAGVRGDMKAVIRAVLLHPEARQITSASGKVREPVLRLSAYLRAFPHRSDTGWFRVGNTDNASTSLGQTPLRSPSVFNFYRPGYVAPGTQTAAAGLVAPEMQLLNETSVAGWVNAMRDNITSGVGQFNGTVGGVALNRRDLQRDWSYELLLAERSRELVAQVAELLLYEPAAPALIGTVMTAVDRITIPAFNGSNQAAINTAKRNRVNAALLLILASPDFINLR
jgi:uncharacterized protein (DUF1800 family)